MSLPSFFSFAFFSRSLLAAEKRSPSSSFWRRRGNCGGKKDQKFLALQQCQGRWVSIHSRRRSRTYQRSQVDLFCKQQRMQKKSNLSRLSLSRRCFVSSSTNISASFAFFEARRNISATQKVEIPPPSSSTGPGWAPYVGARGLVTEAPVVARYPDEFRTSLNETFFKLPLSEQSIMAEYVWIGGSG